MLSIRFIRHDFFILAVTFMVPGLTELHKVQFPQASGQMSIVAGLGSSPVNLSQAEMKSNISFCTHTDQVLGPLLVPSEMGLSGMRGRRITQTGSWHTFVASFARE